MLKHFFLLIPFLPARSNFKFILIVFLFVLCAMLETLGIGMIIPLLTIILTENFIEKYSFLQTLYEFLNINSQIELVTYFLCFIIFIYFFKAIIVTISHWLQANFFMKILLHMKMNLFEKYLVSRYDHFISINSATIMRNLGAIDRTISQYYEPLLMIFAELLIILGISSFLIYSTVQSGLFLIVSLIFVLFIIQFFMKKKLRLWAELQLKLEKKIIKVFHESMYGIKVIKIFGRENFFISNYKQASKNFASLMRNSYVLNQLPRGILELCGILALTIIIYLTISHSKDPTNALSSIAVFVVASFRLMPSANRLVNAINTIREGIPSAKLVIDEFNKKILSKPTDSIKNINFKENIKLDNISFKYPKTNNYIFENVNFDIKKGSCTGFIGKSGSGKSTLIDVFIGLLPLSSGTISVDNKIIIPSSRSWQNLIGYVSQSIYLTDDTIKNNIAFGLSDKQIDNKLIDYSLKTSQLYDFVNSLPDKVDTYVGEHGVRLSGGQRQRIALARALYINPPILVFDEATSSLDTKTEIEIMSSIKELKGVKTILIIAHRLSTLNYCDVIYEIKNNKIYLK